MEITQQRSWFGRSNIFPGSCILGMHSTTMSNKQRYCGRSQNHVWIQNFRRSNWKITMLGKSAYFFKVLWHGWSCKEVCGTFLRVSQQVDTTTPQSIYSMHWWPSIQRKRIGIRGRIVRSMLSNCSEMFILATNWTTWYSMVSEQTDTIDYEMDQSLWQTSESIDFIHSSLMRIQTILSCGEYCQTMQTGTVSRLWLRGRSWRFKIHFWRNIVRTRKSHVCSNKLDVQETDMCVSQFNEFWNFSLDTDLRMDGIAVLDPWNLDITVMHSNSNQKQKDKQARRSPLHEKVSEKRRTAHPIRRA